MNTPLRLERYLDEILAAARLRGSAAIEVRRELSQHLFDLHAAIVKDGWGEPAAGQRAIEEFGDAALLGRSIGLSKRPTRILRFGAAVGAVAAALALAAGIGFLTGGDQASQAETTLAINIVAPQRAAEREPSAESEAIGEREPAAESVIVAAATRPSPPPTARIEPDDIDTASPDTSAAQVEAELVRQRVERLVDSGRASFELRLRLLFVLIRLRLEGRP